MFLSQVKFFINRIFTKGNTQIRESSLFLFTDQFLILILIIIIILVGFVIIIDTDISSGEIIRIHQRSLDKFLKIKNASLTGIFILSNIEFEGNLLKLPLYLFLLENFFKFYFLIVSFLLQSCVPIKDMPRRKDVVIWLIRYRLELLLSVSLFLNILV